MRQARGAAARPEQAALAEPGARRPEVVAATAVARLWALPMVQVVPEAEHSESELGAPEALWVSPPRDEAVGAETSGLEAASSPAGPV